MNNNQPGFQQPTYAPQYQQQVAPVVSMKEWLISLLILIIPVVNIVMMFVWAFSSSSNPSKANYFKAALIVVAVLTVINIVFINVFISILSTVFSV